MRNIRKIALTTGIMTIYCYVWQWLELVIDGKIVNRKVDNIIMLLFVPIIWIATGRIVDDLEKDKERNKKK